jgi:hypothetical protein
MANVLLLILNADSKVKLLEAMAAILVKVKAKNYDKTLEETLQAARDKKEADPENEMWDAEVAQKFGAVCKAIKKHGAAEVLCESCEEAPATHYCGSCDVALFCKACDMHGRVKKFRDHAVKTLAEYKVRTGDGCEGRRVGARGGAASICL